MKQKENFDGTLHEGDLTEILGPEFKGVADVLEVLQQDNHLQSIDDVIRTIRSSFNQFGHFEMQTSNGRRAEFGITSANKPTTIVIEGSIMREVLSMLLNAQREFNQRIINIISDAEKPNEPYEPSAHSAELAV